MMRTPTVFARHLFTRTATLTALSAALLGTLLGASLAFAVDAPTKFTLGPFQTLFETVRPYAMVGFLALGLWALIHNFGRSLTGTLKTRPDGTAIVEHRASIGNLFNLVIFIVVLEGLVYLTLWYGLDLFGSAINLFQQAVTTPPAN